MKETVITIVATGPQGSGKTQIINQMTQALRDRFEITAQLPTQSLDGVETYTFRARLR